MGSWVHRLSNKNIEEKTAICANCGPVSIRYKSGAWRCRVGIRQQKLAVFRNSEITAIGHIAGICPICGKYTDRLVPDHDHIKDQFREWICPTCNSGLGFFYDDPDILMAAASYIKKH